MLEAGIFPWTRRELLEALDDLTKITALSSKLCFFIDGLDEYSGEHTDLVKVIQRLAACPGMKICVSSRPWNVFENAFGQDDNAKMARHEYTNKDIVKYAENILCESFLFMQMVRDESRTWDLVNEIPRKAQSVFL